jgi:hypothetical protein
MSWDTPQRPPFPAAAQKLTISGVAALSNVIGASACVLCASTDVHFLIGGAPVATTADSFLPAKVVIVISCHSTDKISAIQDSAGRFLTVTPLS